MHNLQNIRQPDGVNIWAEFLCFPLKNIFIVGLGRLLLQSLSTTLLFHRVSHNIVTSTVGYCALCRNRIYVKQCSELCVGFSGVVQGFKQQALAVSTDLEHKFELALQLGEVDTAYQLALQAEVRDAQTRINLS